MANPRQIALTILYDIEYNGAYSNMALKDKLSYNKELNKLDKAFITTLVYGVIRRKNTLDYVIGKYSKIKLKKISKYLIIILRMGIYQIMFMDKVPDSAAVNESVKLAKRYGHSASSGFVNGMLHSVIRGRDTLKYPENEMEFLAVKYSFPQWLVEKLISQLGKEFAEDFMKASNIEPKTTLRVNTLKTSLDELITKLQDINVTVSKSDLYENALYVSGFDIGGSSLYKDGLFIAQDISAMLTSIVLNPKNGDYVIDMCAAPGGKTTHIAQLMKNKGKITAFELHSHKVDIIQKNAQRMGIDIIEAVCKDSCEFDGEYEGIADKVLVDVPCSGLGIIRRKPDIKWNKQDDSDLPDIQYKILENAGKYVKIGGELVYSTCTIDINENENIIDKFLENNENFERIDISDLLPMAIDKQNAKNGYVTLYPNINDVDGFFICKLKKR